MLLGENPVYQAGLVKTNLLHLLEKARQKDIPVVFVRNNGGPDAPDTPGSPGWEIDPAFSSAHWRYFHRQVVSRCVQRYTFAG